MSCINGILIVLEKLTYSPRIPRYQAAQVDPTYRSLSRTLQSLQRNTVQSAPYSLFPQDSLEAESATVLPAPYSLFPRDSLETESATVPSASFSLLPRGGLETESATLRPAYEVGHRVAPGTSARSTSISSAAVATSRLGDPVAK